MICRYARELRNILWLLLVWRLLKVLKNESILFNIVVEELARCFLRDGVVLTALTLIYLVWCQIFHDSEALCQIIRIKF